MITATRDTKTHYNRKEVMNTILRVSEAQKGCYRWAVGDSTGWYDISNKGKYAKPMNKNNYRNLTQEYRTLYSTLSFFSPALFDINFREISKEQAKKVSKEWVISYTFGIDIDSKDVVNGHVANIRDPEVKEAVEAMATFFIEKLRPHCPKSIYASFSGGGIYVFVHHGVFEQYLDEHIADSAEAIERLSDALNNLIDSISNQFYKEFPQYESYVKADSLNNAKRVFKTIFSVHRKHPFAVIPLDTKNIEINFEDATLPLSDKVLEAGTQWYTNSEQRAKFMEFLTPYLENSAELEFKKLQRIAVYGGVRISESRFESDSYPPCIKNILAMGSCSKGATRALAFLASFLGQINTSEEEAKKIWYDVAERWKAQTSNVFESWYKAMNCPTCLTLITPGPGYPHIDIANLGACKPDMHCLRVNKSNPVYYVDKSLYAEKLKNDLLRV